jgi:signal transduction protein with GAF and PtsI domain
MPDKSEESLNVALFELQALAGLGKGHRETLEEIARAGVGVLKAEAAGVYVVDEAAREFVFEAIVGGGGKRLEGYRMPLTEGIPGLVLLTGQPQIITQDPKLPKEIVKLTDFQPKEVLCVPLVSDGKIIGVLGFYNRKTSRHFNLKDLETATAFASIGAIVVSHSLRHRDVVAKAEALAERHPELAGANRLASLVKDLAFRGPDEQALCISVLEALTDYLTKRSPR